MHHPFNLFKFIFCTLLFINSILCYDPSKRKFHNSVIIDDRLLIFNGITDTSTYSLELFYLDLSKSFDNNKLTWTSIPEGSLPVYTWVATAVLSLDNSTIYLYGGFMINKDTSDYDFSNLVYTYNYSTSTWSTPKPKLGGDTVPARQYIKGVIDNSGIIYIFGGYNVSNLTTNIGYLYNDMNILNTVSNTWTTLSISGDLPTICGEYTADILPSGIIVYIGGMEKVSYYAASFTLVNINKIKLFDTNKYEWSQMNATGDEIDSRICFTSVLTPDGYIIIFGGSTYATTDADLSSVNPKLAILNTNKNPFEWSIPSDSEINSPPSIYGHTANLYNDLMIITFGFNLDTQFFSSSGQVYLYNIKSNKWVTTFGPSPSPSPSSSPKPSTTPTLNSSSKALAIGLGTGIGGAVLVSCIFIAIFVYRRRADQLRQQPNILQIPSSN
ncbi:hypothetical protein Glove_109g246 [Diversispora epigaea]|uniref:Galactose oxidase n=1 Tax=Diversispora epigaea TaxID=1348612 RepID=A0A397J2F7_9GLOM|nr:hypothetical protein Glove_109g246 [Diversispora epigaea]